MFPDLTFTGSQQPRSSGSCPSIQWLEGSPDHVPPGSILSGRRWTGPGSPDLPSRPMALAFHTMAKGTPSLAALSEIEWEAPDSEWLENNSGEMLWVWISPNSLYLRWQKKEAPPFPACNTNRRSSRIRRIKQIKTELQNLRKLNCHWKYSPQ